MLQRQAYNCPPPPNAGRERNTAFTLAETLITLAIIGVVAALTMPSLIAKHEKKVTAARAKQTYSQLYQAIQLSIIDNGNPDSWDTMNGVKDIENTKRFLKKYLLPYLKNPVFCANGQSEEAVSKCGAANFSVSQSYILSNGVVISVMPYHNPIMNIVIDINGPKKPNHLGNDQFQFTLHRGNNSLSFLSELEGFTREDILTGKNTIIDDNTYNVSCKKSKSDEQDTYYRHGCTALLMLDGWEIKDDYPW